MPRLGVVPLPAENVKHPHTVALGVGFVCEAASLLNILLPSAAVFATRAHGRPHLQSARAWVQHVPAGLMVGSSLFDPNRNGCLQIRHGHGSFRP
jgi:hypothetical protein